MLQRPPYVPPLRKSKITKRKCEEKVRRGKERRKWEEEMNEWLRERNKEKLKRRNKKKRKKETQTMTERKKIKIAENEEERE